MKAVTIVVFGERNIGRILTGDGYSRVSGAANLFDTYKGAGYSLVDIIFLGGIFHPKQRVRAVSQAMRERLLFEHPEIPFSAVKVETKSTTTAENIEELERNFAYLLKDREVMYVTSHYHVPRVKFLLWWILDKEVPMSAFLGVGTSWKKATKKQKFTELMGMFFPWSDVIIRKLRKRHALSQPQRE